jgi:putative salt-induced outer membrane protein YdiY
VHAQPAPAAPAHTEKVSLDEFKSDLTSFSTSFGGALTSGNTRSTSASVGAAFGMVRGSHALDLSMDFLYGRAVLPKLGPGMRDTARNLRSRGRYAFFLSDMDALFAAGAYRWDTYSGLDARLQGQAGYMRNLYLLEKMRIWGEVGYDLTYENYDPDPLPDPANMGRFLKGYQYLHSARLFFGYDNQINPAVVVAFGIEGLLNVQHPKDSRINGDLAIRSVLIDRLQLELKGSVQYDSQPVSSTYEKFDAIVKLNLILTLI